MNSSKKWAWVVLVYLGAAKRVTADGSIAGCRISAIGTLRPVPPHPLWGARGINQPPSSPPVGQTTSWLVRTGQSAGRKDPRFQL